MHPSSFLPAVANSDATALHDAAEWGFRETCLELLLAGAPLHALDGYKCTPRQRAEFRMVIRGNCDGRAASVCPPTHSSPSRARTHSHAHTHTRKAMYR